MTSREIYEQLTRKIADGTYAADGKLPSESKLCDAFKVARMTISQPASRPEAVPRNQP